MSWITGTFGGHFISWGPLLDQGIRHGFGDLGFSYHSESRLEVEGRLKEVLSVDTVIHCKQVHGSAVVHSASGGSLLEGDIITTPLGAENASVVFIKTADCVPLIVVGRESAAIVHAGWRGLADMAVESGLSSVASPSLVLIGPAAGGCCYEVKSDVVDAMSARGVFTRRDGKIFLDTILTAKKIVRAYDPNIEIQTVGHCTICCEAAHISRDDERFRYNSYRRSGNQYRNITFVTAK
jgi:copper oxidase (laccase) domain-containing protein